MRIAVVNNFFPPRSGGSAHLSDSLAKQYAKLGHEVLVLTASYGQSPSFEIRDGIQIHRLPSFTLPKNPLASNFDISFTLSRSNYKRLSDLLVGFKPDLIHQHGQFFDLTWMSGVWAKNAGVPTLLSIHTRLESVSSWFNNLLYSVADRLVVAPILKMYNPEVVIMDNLMDEYIRKRYSNGTFPRKHYFPVGVDADELRGGNPESIQRDPRFIGKKLIVSIGHVIPQRNRVNLVKALPKLIEKNPNFCLVVLGEIYDDSFLKLASKFGVSDWIVAEGAVPKSRVRDFLAAADLEVHDLEGCGFGTASLEALATGVPVVAAVDERNFPGVELIDGVHLFRVSFKSDRDRNADTNALAEVLGQVLEDTDLARLQVSENGMRFVNEHFTITRVANQHINAFREMIKEPKE